MTETTRRLFEESEKLFDDALEVWGVESQVNMVLEEIGELIVAIQKKRRFGDRRSLASGVAEEVADVLITVNQLRRIAGEELVDGLVDYKLDRLEERIGQARRLEYFAEAEE